MRVKKRNNEQELDPTRSLTPQAGSGGEKLRDLRNQGESLINACDRAIARALSGDSQDFITRSEQEGGE